MKKSKAVGVHVGSSYTETKTKREIADQIFMMLVQRFQKTGVPGAGLEIAKNSKTAILATFIKRKYNQMEVVIMPSKIVFALKSNFNGITTDELRNFLTQSGFMGDSAIDNYAELLDKAAKLGLKMEDTAEDLDPARATGDALAPLPPVDDRRVPMDIPERDVDDEED